MSRADFTEFEKNVRRNFQELTNEQFIEQLESMLFVDDYSGDMTEFSLIENKLIMEELKRRMIWNTL